MHVVHPEDDPLDTLDAPFLTDNLFMAITSEVAPCGHVDTCQALWSITCYE